MLPSVLFGANIIPFKEGEIKRLQQIENGVYRGILGAPKYAPIAALRGEIGSSEMKTRIITSKLQYMGSILRGENE